MKRVGFLSVLLATILALPVRAQLYKSDDPTLKVGVTAGLNIEHMWANAVLKPYTNKVKPGFFVGPTVFYNMPALGLGFDLSLFYDQRAVGSKDLPNVSVKSQSIQLPLNIRYGVNLGNMIMPYVFAGPQLAINVGKKVVPFASGTGMTTGHALIRQWEPKSLAMSLNFGVGIVALEKVQARVSYNLALRRTGWFCQVDVVDGSRRFLSVGRLHSCQVAVSYFF